VYLVGALVDGSVEVIVDGTLAVGYWLLAIGDWLLGIVGKILFAEVDQLFEFHVTDDGDDHLVGGIVLVEERRELFRREMLDVFFVAEDIVGERVAAEDHLLEVVVDEFGRRVLVEVDLFDDHILLFLNFVLGKGGVEEDVAEKLQAALEVLRESRGIDAGLLLGSEGVELATNAVDAVADVVGAAVFGAFEDRMLDEVGDALFGGTVFVAGAYIDIYAGIDNVGVVLSEDDPDAVGEGVVEVHSLLFFGVGEVWEGWGVGWGSRYLVVLDVLGI